MVDLVQIFMDVIGVFWTFVETYMIPATVADVNIIHVAIWTPIMLGLVTGTIGTLRGLFRSRRA